MVSVGADDRPVLRRDRGLARRCGRCTSSTTHSRTQFQEDTTSPRGLVGVVLHADVNPDIRRPRQRGPRSTAASEGDPTGISRQNNVVLEFLGDYVYADATDDYGVAVWNDVRARGLPCDRRGRRGATAVQAAGPAAGRDSTRPAIQQESDPGTFGNSDIWAWSGPD